MKVIPVEGKQNSNLFRHPTTGIIYFREYRAGFGEKFVSLRTDNLNEARVKADQVRNEWLGLKPKKKVIKLFDELWNDFLETKKSSSLAHYYNIESRGRLHILPFFKDWALSEINKETGKLYCNHAWGTHSGRKLFNDIKALNMFLKYCFNVGAKTELIAFEYPDPPTEAGKVFSQDEVERLITNSQGDLQLQILMAVTMGMRRGEIENLQWDRIDLPKKLIHLKAQETKIRQARSFGISKPVYDILLIKHTIRKELRSTQSHVFGNPNDYDQKLGRNGYKKAWATCKAKAGVRGRFHDLRHTFLTNAFKQSVNPALICEYAGLSLDEAQKTYLHFTPEDTRLVSTLFKLSKKTFGENSGKRGGKKR